MEKQVAMGYYVDICVILCKDPVKEMKHGEFSGGKRDACNRTTGTDRKPDQEERSSSDSRTHKAVQRVGSNNALYPTNFPMLSVVGSVSDLAGNGDLKFETTEFLENDYLFFPNINFNAANALSLTS